MTTPDLEICVAVLEELAAIAQWHTDEIERSVKDKNPTAFRLGVVTCHRVALDELLKRAQKWKAHDPH